MSVITKMLSNIAVSQAKSLISMGIRGQVKKLIDRHLQKSPEDIEKEIISSLGYMTSHYKISKAQKITFTSSSVFLHEWMINSTDMAGKIIRDEESGKNYYNGEPLTNQNKIEIINAFVKATDVKSTALSYHFDAALRLIDVTDFNSIKFKKDLSGWKEGDTSVIDSWMENCFGTALSSDPVYARLLFRKWIIGTAARAINPGKTLDGCLVLRGDVDIGKTQFFRQLLPVPFEQRTGEVYCDIKNSNKFVESLLGKTVACFDELSILDHHKTTEIFKQLLTSQFIDVRLAWAREVRRFNIRVGLGATTNKDKFIPDPSLSRRLWTIELNNSQRLNFDYLNANKKSLWMEAVYLSEKGETCILTPEERKMVEAYNLKFTV